MSDGGPQGLGVLKTNNPGKAAAVKALTEDIQPDTGTAGTVADEATTKAVTAFTDWATGSGLKDVATEWDKQVKALQGRLAADRTALQGTRYGFQSYDIRTGSTLNRFLLPPTSQNGN
ncbi:hypothetical protein LRS74_19445 [Streptomyces sp. LX-29]|uniref:hypothetical protein n=1 Tax=Streptomyces sp. LX-29 TaxID=2900152 RepID=UPI00240E041D|nr:hypothetical protein [Streptomyces sp. LX-29]WFB08974.1 hypothetical protein LRS74_19445 [Streptomyces sp. LX-29]